MTSMPLAIYYTKYMFPTQTKEDNIASFKMSTSSLGWGQQTTTAGEHISCHAYITDSGYAMKSPDSI